MSPGLGGLQREIKRVLNVVFDTYGAVQFADIHSYFIAIMAAIQRTATA